MQVHLPGVRVEGDRLDVRGQLRGEAGRDVRPLVQDASREAITAPAAAAPEAPVKTRDMAPPGFHRALAAHQAVPRVQRVSSDVTEAIERQHRAMRELSRRAFPEPDAAPDDAPASMNDARLQRRRQAAATEAAALRRARAEKAGRPMAAPQQLERTA
ncbi:hypothetical protein [Streptomyces sp. NRRL F-5650]|uniref:hypothetical protein n=1 Tax=Streptomyces sp. NRRL F-5650 TaxID=1463868 RepID=UPI000AB0E0FA|nr:hypothetical protein [Streptomyces sp. NRRL F-5650]